MGRKDKYDTHVRPYLDQISEWYELLTEGQIAEKLGVSKASLETYKKKHPELLESMHKGRKKLVEDLKASLKKKAKGFYYEETRTTIRQTGSGKVEVIEKFKRYAPPDTGAIHLLLKNLDDTWRNDDQATLDLKREKMQMEKEKAEKESW